MSWIGEPIADFGPGYVLKGVRSLEVRLHGEFYMTVFAEGEADKPLVIRHVLHHYMRDDFGLFPVPDDTDD